MGLSCNSRLPIMFYAPGRTARRPRPSPARCAPAACSPPPSPLPPCRGGAARRSPRRRARAVQGRRGRRALRRRPRRARRWRRASRTRVVKLRTGESVAGRGPPPRPASRRPQRDAQLHRPRVGLRPADPGRAGAPGGWQALQWNFLPLDGRRRAGRLAAPHRRRPARRPGRDRRGAGHRHRLLQPRRLPALARLLVGRASSTATTSSTTTPFPNDENGHGTHVAGTIAEGTGNGVGVTGLAYGVKLMPVRVLDRDGEGDTVPIAKGIRWAADHGAKVINLSFEFPPDVTRQQIPDILDALRHARHKGVLVVGAAGNAGARAVAYPARAPDVLSVGATTRARLPGRLLRTTGQDLDVVAPGGGDDARPAGRPELPPAGPARRRHLPGDVPRHAARGASACRAATSARRWPRRTSRPRPRW